MTKVLIETIPYKNDFMGLCLKALESDGSCVLNSFPSAQQQARYSIIGRDPFLTLKGSLKDLLPQMQALMDRFSFFKQHAKQNWPVGAMLGAISYDQDQGQDDSGSMRQAYFGCYDVLLVMDHQQQEIILISTGLPEIQPKQRLLRAKERLAESRRWFKSCPAKFIKSSVSIKAQPQMSADQFEAMVSKALKYIRAGDIYQVNLAQKFCFDIDGDWRDLLVSFYAKAQAGFGGVLRMDEQTLMSFSPERFFSVADQNILVRPMKGTRPVTGDAKQDENIYEELQRSMKDQAELLMITDLMRNDLGRICQYGSVRVPTLRQIEKYPYVYQATSIVTGQLRPDLDLSQLILSLFPGGSVTGCPKIRSMDIISELEPVRRGFYTGSMGYIGFNGRMDFNILIRTLFCQGRRGEFFTGCGIVADSDPAAEYEESLVKANVFDPSLLKCGEV